MPSIYGADLAKVEVQGKVSGVSYANVLWCESLTGGVTISKLADLALSYKAFVWDPLQVRLATQTTLDTVTTTDWTAPFGEQWVEVVNEAGTLATGVVSGQVAVVVSHLTNFTGRSRRGRTYVAGIGEELVSGNNIITTLQTELLVAFNSWNTELLGIGWQHVVSSTQQDGVPRISRFQTPVLNYRVDSRVDTQRRRLPRAFSN